MRRGGGPFGGPFLGRSKGGFALGFVRQRAHALSAASEAALAVFRYPARERYLDAARWLRGAFMAVLQGRVNIL